MKTRTAPTRIPQDDPAADSANPQTHDIPASTPPPIAAHAASQARALLHEISGLANSAIRLSAPRASSADDPEDDDRDERIQMLRQSLERVGWVADVALRQLGDTGAFERAEDWMLARL
ncbi:hypothetical protein GT347_25485 [Xylophilus rhododendri]|uniref:Uncharacterized protein n=1 Tax=Xylophilus rhododendri TaxID=2697032 RepID=A0A857JDK5_9BURK|nr:hypothetical protein [Xylophilus rhododendri]QHJ01043.1 hypothetical protein GT347_25485 [Xylophilus rhododendri]